MVALAISVVARQGLQDLARPVLQRLADQTGETSLIGTLASDADLVMYVDKVESANPVRYTVPLGERRELYASAVGKVLLAHMAADRCDTYLRNEKLRAFTPKTITSVRTLRQEISEIREAGLALTVDERVVGVSALAAPIHGEGGRVIAAIVIAGPSERMRTALKQHKASLRAAAKSLSLAMAGTTTH
jgi:DNA-binding IclR family transcriptional regulator